MCRVTGQWYLLTGADRIGRSTITWRTSTGGCQATRTRATLPRKGLLEHLFYTNLNDGKIVPWMGESFEYNDTLDEIDVKVREGVKWSDGVPFTAHDFKFTIDMVIANAPDMNRSTLYQDKIESVTVHDDYNFTMKLTRPDPRGFSKSSSVSDTRTTFR